MPALAGRNAYLHALAAALSSMAGWFALVFLLPAPVAFINSLRRRHLIEGQATIERLRSLGWQEFELLVSEHYKRKGYRVVETGGGGADRGIDLILRDESSKKIVVQCKRWAARACPATIRNSGGDN
jgi:restriction system protein